MAQCFTTCWSITVDSNQANLTCDPYDPAACGDFFVYVPDCTFCDDSDQWTGTTCCQDESYWCVATEYTDGTCFNRVCTGGKQGASVPEICYYTGDYSCQ